MYFRCSVQAACFLELLEIKPFDKTENTTSKHQCHTSVTTIADMNRQ